MLAILLLIIHKATVFREVFAHGNPFQIPIGRAHGIGVGVSLLQVGRLPAHIPSRSDFAQPLTLIAKSWAMLITIAPACADRSGGPPKPGAAYENQPGGAAGGPLGGRRGPTGPGRAHGDAVACPWGPNINPAPIRDSRATRGAMSGPVVPNQGPD